MTDFKNFAILPIFAASLVAAIVVIFTPYFGEMFKSFGTELPAITRFLLASYWGWLVLPTFAILSVQFTQKGTRLRANAVLATIVISALAMCLFVAAVYSPVLLSGAPA